MIAQAWISSVVCVLVMIFVTYRCRMAYATLGLPVAYLFLLELIHVPGAIAYAISDGVYGGVLVGQDYASRGILLTAVGSVAYAVGFGVYLRGQKKLPTTRGKKKRFVYDPGFARFCAIAGLGSHFLLGPFKQVPSLGAAIVFGSSLWMLGVILGLSHAVRERRFDGMVRWSLVAMIYPINMLLFGGFMSYGSTALVIVGALALVRIRSRFLLLTTVIVVGYLGLSIFVTYFEDRTQLRDVYWSGAAAERRISVTSESLVSGFELVNFNNERHLDAMSQRLNQNELVGLAQERVDTGIVGFIKGRTLYEGLISPIPRVLWPSKPVYGGSPAIVRDMTGLELSTTTSWGVGNVMEFYINFGYVSLILGFFALGWVLARLDAEAYRCVAEQRWKESFKYFLPAVALIQPNGSMVELVGGASAAFMAALGWGVLWDYTRKRRSMRRAATIQGVGR